MWKKSKDETSMEAIPNAPSIARPLEGGPSALPPPRMSASDSRVEARIGKSVTIKGTIMGQEDLYLDGEIEGMVELPENRFVIGKSGKVQANIKAKEVDVLGTVHGDIVAGERITIRKDATLVGNLKSSTISIEDGAFFKGSIDIVRPAPVKAAPAMAAPAPPPPPAPIARLQANPTGPGPQIRNR